jgi:chlorobactene glucosyltransferase
MKALQHLPIWRRRPVYPVELFLAVALLLLETLLLLRAWRERAALRPLRPIETPLAPNAASVDVIVPARDEAHNIGKCLECLCAQSYLPERLRIIVVDDGSGDGTDRIVGAFAKHDVRVSLLRSGPLQRGWTGKTQACWRGAALPSDSEWLCFIDADMRAEPSLIASAVAEADRGIDLLSLTPRHRLVSFAERLMIPCGLYLLGFRQNLTSIRARGTADANVTGQFMLIRRAAYRRLGGHASVSGAICEDLELARLTKRSGFSLVLMDGSQLLSTRMYSGWTTLWPGFAKNILETFGGVRSTLVTAAAAVIVSWAVVILPAVDYAGRGVSLEGSLAFALTLVAAACAVGFHVAGAAYFDVPLWYGLLFPAGYTLGGIIALDGLRLRAAGRVPWKGRVYA